MSGVFVETVLGTTIGVTIAMLFSAWLFFYIWLQIISVFVFNRRKSEAENIKMVQATLEQTALVILLFFTFMPMKATTDYFMLLGALGIGWGVLISMWIIRLIDRSARRLKTWLDKNIIPSLNKRAGLIYEHEQRYARFVVKSRKNEPNRSGWVYLETKKNLYIKSDQSERTYRIKKDNVGKPNYPVLSLELSNAPQV